MQILKTHSQQLSNLGRYFYFEAQDGRHRVLVCVAPNHLQVIVQNSSHQAWRGMGKRFETIAAAIANYKTAEVRRIIEVAHYEARVSKLEEEGLTRSDAQGVVDAEDMRAKVRP
jgi:hypothetical protein